MTTSRELLEGAVSVLEREGWAQHHYGSVRVDEPHCAFGALQRAYYLTGEWDGYRVMGEGPFYAAIVILNEVIDGVVVSWNDVPGRTLAEVIEGFQKATKVAIRRDEEVGHEEAA